MALGFLRRQWDGATEDEIETLKATSLDVVDVRIFLDHEQNLLVAVGARTDGADMLLLGIFNKPTETSFTLTRL